MKKLILIIGLFLPFVLSAQTKLTYTTYQVQTMLDYVYGVTSSIQGQLNGKEASLGNPSVTGYVLSSTTAGVRSWIAPATGSGDVTSTGTQTLTNKTLTSPKINENVVLTATATQLNAAVADLADYVTLDISKYRRNNDHDSLNTLQEKAYSSLSGKPTLGTASAQDVGYFATAAQGTDARTPTSHTHGNITNAGAIGSTATLPVITTTSGVLTVGSFGTSAGTFTVGNDSRLSDARTPSAHTQAVSTISDATTIGQNLVKLANPSAITFFRGNANNTIDALSASAFRTAISGLAIADSTTGTGKYATDHRADLIETDLGNYVTLDTAALLLHYIERRDTAAAFAHYAKILNTVKLQPDSVQHTTYYSVGAGDIGKDQMCLKTSGSMAITIPASLTAWKVGTWMTFLQEGGAILVFKKASGVRFLCPLDSIATKNKGDMVNVKKIGTNAYALTDMTN